MTATQLAAMKQGREEQLERLREQQARDYAGYMQWVELEAAAYRKRLHLIDEFGRDSGEYIDANRDWLDLLKSRPTAPPDSASCWRS